jgi:hypothetical protein
MLPFFKSRCLKVISKLCMYHGINQMYTHLKKIMTLKEYLKRIMLLLTILNLKILAIQ